MRPFRRRAGDLRRLGGAVLALLSMAGCQSLAPAANGLADLAIEDVTVIDPGTRRVLAHSSVLVRDGQIVAVEPADRRTGWQAARTVDGRGKYLIPGLADMHVHLFLPEPPGPTLKLLLANGVTGIREMSSDCWAIAGATKGCIADYKALQAQIRSGAVIGPDLLSLTSTMVMGPTRLTLPAGVDPFVTPVTAEQGRRLVDYLAGRGIDRIKTHDSIPLPAFTAMMKRADEIGIEVSGHVPFGAGSLGAARLGYGSIEHARDLLYDCSRYGPAFRQASEDFSAGRSATRPTNLERLSRTVDEFDAAQCERFLQALAKTGVYYVPTHVTREMEARAAEPDYRNDPRRKYIAHPRNERWEADLAETAALPEAERLALGRFFEAGLQITGMAFRAGVPIMAGTDTSDTMIVPGFSLHRELALLRRAGLSAMDVLRSATSVPAAYLGQSRVRGGIAPEMEADLVLLDANPLDDIGNTRSIRAVIADGTVFDRAALDRLLADAEREAVGDQVPGDL